MINPQMGAEGSQQPRNFQELRQKHQQEKSQIESRRHDLRLAQMLARALDPALPKGFRQMGLRQVAKTVGVDPRGEAAKEMIGAFSGLDPQSLEGLRRGLIEDIHNVKPGEIAEVTKGIMSGSAPPENLLHMISKATKPAQMAMGRIQGAKGGEPFTHAPYGIGDAGFGFQGTPTEPPEKPLPPPGTPGGGPMMFPERKKTPTEGQFPKPMGLGGPEEVPEEEMTMVEEQEGLPLSAPKKVGPGRQEIEGEIPAMFNLEPGRYRIEDVRAAGYDKIPDNPTDRRKMVNEIKAMQSGTLNSLSMINQIAGAVRGRPEVLDLPGGWNPATIWENTVEFAKSLYNITDQVAPQLIADSPEMRKVSDQVFNWIGETSGLAPIARTADEIARTRAKVKSMLMSLSYTIARAEQGAGVLTNQDVLSTLESLGESQSPDIFISALESTSNRLYSKYKQTTKVQTGKEVPLAQLATDDVVQAMNAGGLVPKGLWSEKGQSPKVSGTTEELVEPSGVVKQEVPRTGRTLEQEEEEERRLAQQEAEWRQRQRGLVEEQAGFARERQGFAREEAKRGEERMAMARREEQRAIEREQRLTREKRAESIQQAFVELGRAFRFQPVQPPQMGGGGGGMNPAAFQAGQIQRRQAPTIPDTIRRRQQGG